MPRVISTHRHASESINGIAFEPHKLGRISEDISQEQADVFLSIPGYVSEDGTSTAKVEKQETKVLEGGSFRETSFADKQANMPTKLQESSPGFERKESTEKAPEEGKALDGGTERSEASVNADEKKDPASAPEAAAKTAKPKPATPKK